MGVFGIISSSEMREIAKRIVDGRADEIRQCGMSCFAKMRLDWMKIAADRIFGVRI